MPLHLAKLAVGVSDVPHLKQVQKRKINDVQKSQCNDHALFHVTRNTPRRVDEILNNGSLYWVIKGNIQVRQKIIGFEKVERSNKKAYCSIALDPELIVTQLKPMRPFQGWRYLSSYDAPVDAQYINDDDTTLPDNLLKELQALGLI